MMTAPLDVEKLRRIAQGNRRIKRALLLIALLLLGVGCTTMWVHPRKGEQDFSADSAFCEAQAGQAAGPNDAFGVIRRRVYGHCMRGKGWKPEEEQ